MKLKYILGASLCVILSGCGIFKPYQMPIQQGIQINQSTLQGLKPGMSEAQVEYILGTPNIKDAFHPNEWYYVYTDLEQGKPYTESKFVVYFKNQKFDHYQILN